MNLSTTMRRLYEGLSWNVRGAFASESNRRAGFWARNLFQPAEIAARKRRAQDTSVIAPADCRIPEREGYRQLAAAAMPDVAAVCEAGRKLARATIGDVLASPWGKAFHRDRLATDEHLPALLDVALDPRMIAMATTYLGIVPIINNVDYFVSLPSQPPWSKSQLWHCDDDAAEHLKVFIYCDDVTADDGPFEMIDAADSYRVRNAIGYRYAGRRYRVSDAEMDRHVPHDRQLSVTGARGSAVVVDTARCFHRGSRIPEPGHHRMVALLHYCPPNAARLPLRLASGGAPYARLAARYPGELARAVLGQPLSGP
jgi:hypothetical protein